jgi:hypothetical protein
MPKKFCKFGAGYFKLNDQPTFLLRHGYVDKIGPRIRADIPKCLKDIT